MQFSIMQTRVAEETGLSVTDDVTKIKAWINEAYQQVSGFYNWPWLLTNFVIQTVTDITTLTAAVNAGATTVTLSSTVTPTLAGNYWIRFDASSDDWYPITAHTAASATVTIGNAYLGATNITGAAVTIRKVFYDIPSGVDRIIDLRQSISDKKIQIIDPRTVDHVLPDPDTTGTPDIAYLTGITVAGAWRMSFYPLPSAKINIQGRGYATITELSADADVPLIPTKWHSVLVFLALALFGHDYIDDTRIDSAQKRAKETIKEMIKESNPVPGMFNVIRTWDTRQTNHNTYGFISNIGQ